MSAHAHRVNKDSGVWRESLFSKEVWKGISMDWVISA